MIEKKIKIMIYFFYLLIIAFENKNVSTYFYVF